MGCNNDLFYHRDSFLVGPPSKQENIIEEYFLMISRIENLVFEFSVLPL